MNLLTDEKTLMEGDNKQVVLTTHRIRQENVEWGKLNLISLSLEHVTSCEYSRKSKPGLLVGGLLLLGFAFAASDTGGQQMVGGLGLMGLILIVAYFMTIKRGLIISSPSARIIVDTKGMKDDNIKSFIDKLEVAKNERLKARSL
jgi:hypothetical protein